LFREFQLADRTLRKVGNDTILGGVLGKLIEAKTAELKANWLLAMKQNKTIPEAIHVLARGYKNVHEVSIQGDKLTVDVNYTSPHPSIPLEAMPEILRKQYAELDTKIAEHFAILFSGTVVFVFRGGFKPLP